LVLCGCELGNGAATEMAESSLLGLVAAVALPLAYLQAVRLGLRLPTALAAAVGGYFLVASDLGCLPHFGPFPRVCIGAAAIVAASCWAGRVCIRIRGDGGGHGPFSPWWTTVLRTAVPALYVLALAAAERVAGPGWAGLVSTFPSMSLVVLVVTHLESGPAEATRIARVLPTGNTSTLAFLAAFRFICPAIGLSGGTISGYAAAFFVLLAIEWFARHPDFVRLSIQIARESAGPCLIPWSAAARPGATRVRIHAHAAPTPRYLGRLRRPTFWYPAARTQRKDRGGFAPLVETLAA
jgi:hypothetical protein